MILSKISIFHSLGFPILIGTSRKKFINQIAGKYDTKERIGGTLASVTFCFSQGIKMDGAIIVSTPQEIALQDVKRGIKMFDKLGVKIIGLVDNMSHFIGDDGKKYPIFGEGGVKKTADEFQKEFLGEIPINPEVGKLGDLGTPIVESKPEHEISKIYIDFAKKIKSIYLI